MTGERDHVARHSGDETNCQPMRSSDASNPRRTS